MKLFTFCLTLFTFSLCNAQLAKYVNPFIGTGGTGHTFPGATKPFAMVQLSPDTRIDGSWEGCSGYHYNDSIIYGFSHTHLSGTGCSDYGDIAFMPYFSKTDEFEKLKTENLKSKFSHKNEKASAGYYSVVLDDIPVKVELTATTRTGFQRYTFNEDGYGYVVLNLKHRDELLQGKIQKLKPKIYKGIRVSKAWAKMQELYYGFEINTEPIDELILSGDNNDWSLTLKFKVTKGQQILIKTGISTVDEDAALNNLKVENSGWDFEKIKQQANDSWEKELRKIEVQDAKLPSPLGEGLGVRLKDQLTTFYTAMYHCMIHPSIMNDVDGRYKGRDGKIHKAEGFNYYTVFSLWDTHRALHPLLNIIDKKRSHDFVITFLKQFEQSGRLPMWELWNNETDCMIGFHSVSVILDAYRKQVISKDELQQLWPAVKAEAMSNRFGLDKFREKGYLSVEDESESVSKTLEYSYDMWCVSEIASELGFEHYYTDVPFFGNKQHNWQNLYNPETGFIQPRKNGNWLQDFNPFEVNNNYTEANAWQYSFYAPQSYTPNNTLLDSLFKALNKTQGRTQADITGLIGQYAHGNEPSHNYIYLLRNNKREKYLKYVLDSFYTNKPDGLIGNEDCGQMSAWYVMSALGFYQTCPGIQCFTIEPSLFQKTKVRLGNGKTVFFIKKPHINENIATTLCELTNHKTTSDLFVSFNYCHIFKFENSQTIYNVRSQKLNAYKNYYEGIHMNGPCESQAPLISSSQTKPFVDSIKIAIDYLVYHDNYCLKSLFYSINNSPHKKYETPFYITESSTIKAFEVLIDDTLQIRPDTSHLSIAHFYKRPHNYSIQLNCKYNKQYTADGDDGIIDGQYGDIDWKKGGWQGYQSQDFEAIIDMKEKREFAEISANFLQDTRSWILFPTKVECYTSEDNVNFKLQGTVENTIAANDYNVQTQKLKFKTQKQFEVARYIKVKAYNYGELPEWHAGKGDDAFIFIDEIEIK